MDSSSYLDEHAAKFQVQYPQFSDYITELLAKYKKALKEDLVDIGSSSEEVIGKFEHDIRKHCLRGIDQDTTG
jgi:hypothetical protein